MATVATMVAVAGFSSGCGSDDSERAADGRPVATGTTTPPAMSPTAEPSDTAAPSDTAEPSEDSARHDADVDRALDERERAAAAGDRAKLAMAQKELDRLAEGDPDPPAESEAADPFRRMLDEFRFKQAPLYIQQVTSSDDHRIYISVNRDAFCLMTVAARRAAAAKVYQPADRRLREADVTDFEFILAPVTATAPTYKQALAVGKQGRLRLTRRGRDC